ncbi:hypothetical protein JVT61DRAFT_6740 [Boletus reticuloceps]|uniref:DUF6589 domain-containing protein n=1 Tax=Boletus reticuloceps TaxID=495285 RepID=A0A8I3A658_9AGAM|nr:hypothetical protein JVT61DRAFT_6740 [Boletus reticuloceps]
MSIGDEVQADQTTSKAICYHLLINPTGKQGKFQGVDWCVELNNLYTKVYQNLHSVFARNFLHAHLSSYHTEADMTKTFFEVCRHLSEDSPHVVKPGGLSRYNVSDLLSQEAGMVDTSEWNSPGNTVATEEYEERATLEDLAVELGM